MDLLHILAPRFLMQTVNVLRDDSVQLSMRFHLRQLHVRSIRKHISGIQVFPEIRKEHFGFTVEALAAEQIFRPVPRELLIVFPVQPVFASEIRDAALCRYACPAKEHNIGCFFNDPVKHFNLLLFGQAFLISFSLSLLTKLT